MGQRDSQLRGEIKSLAQLLVVAEYQLAGLTKSQLSERIKWLVDGHRFTFRDVDTVRLFPC